MRKYLIWLTLGACLIALGPGTPALAAASTHYVGTNSQGEKLQFTVAQTASGPVFEPNRIFQNIRCPATGEQAKVGEAFVGFHAPIRNGKFTFVANDLPVRLRWTGTVTPAGAAGLEAIHVAGFDDQGGLQDCNAGSLSWTALPVAPGSPAATAPRATYIVTFTRAPDGSVHSTITH